MVRESVKRVKSVIEYAIWGEGCLQVRHFFWFIDDVVDPGSLRGPALGRQVTDFVTVVALVWRLVWHLVWFDLCHVSLGWPGAPWWGTSSVARVHRYWSVVHPLRGIGRCHLLWRKVSLGRLVSSWHLGRVGVEGSEVRCILHDRIDQLHRFDDCNEPPFHRFIGDRHGWREDFVE